MKFDHICDPDTDQSHGHGNCNDVTSGHDQKSHYFDVSAVLHLLVVFFLPAFELLVYFIPQRINSLWLL